MGHGRSYRKMADLSRLSEDKLLLELLTRITKCRLDEYFPYSAQDQSLASYIQRETAGLEVPFTRVSIPEATYEDDSEHFRL